MSLFDKNCILELARSLIINGYSIVATSTTHKYLADNSIISTTISEYTGYPEILSGRVKTLNNKIFAGILANRSIASDLEEINSMDIKLFDVVIVDLYPFQDFAKKESDLAKAIEHIDIGGSSLLRAAAKNYNDVSVLCSKNDYSEFLERLNANTIDYSYRFKLAVKAFKKIADYDIEIHSYLLRFNTGTISKNINLRSLRELRYGENPHQSAEVYSDDSSVEGFSRSELLNGKNMSYNNYIDANAAWEIVNDFELPACAIIKHTNPCGLATASNILDAYINAYNSDSKSAFGGVIAINREVTIDLALEIKKQFAEVIVSDNFTDEALKVLKAKINLRLLLMPKYQPNNKNIVQINGAWLIQDFNSNNEFNPTVVSGAMPNFRRLEDAKFAQKVVKHCKSNALVLVRDNTILAIGSGQMSRVDCMNIIEDKIKALNISTKNSVLASDGFFPFDDIIHICSTLGIEYIIQPGGSMRDSIVIDTAKKLNITMIFTGIRHFKH